ncbi:cyclase family protein [Streptomyces sp. NPDC059142]|uniref:cyclase family protein n=1 Tax=Streptomyces sp. NPDC059142 TaxID=3346739 RepID=UPI0036C96C5B
MSSPTYDELGKRTDAPAWSSWGLFGESDERGTANLAGPAELLAAARAVRRGVAINLDYPLDAFSPPIAAHRETYEHHLTGTHADQRDDYLDRFWLQAGSQIDGLRHRRHFRHGFYNGFPDEAVEVGSPTLGVQRWAEQPLAGRGVLVDVERYRTAQGQPIDHASGERLHAGVLDETLEWQDAQTRPGDILLLRTGWTAWYLALDEERKAEVRRSRCWTGMEADRETLGWLWDHGFALAASDTMAFEALPASGNAEFGGPNEPGMIHQDLLGLLGLPIGELWDLDELSRDSEESGQFDCLLVVSPLNLTGGVGSPANAVALR